MRIPSLPLGSLAPALALLTSAALFACSEEAEPDLGLAVDEGAGAADDSMPDAGPIDSGPPDAGPLPDLPVTFTEVASTVGLVGSQNALGACPYRVMGDCQPAQFSGGVAVTDIDGDGRLDVYLSAIIGAGRLYRFDGTRYIDVTADYGLDQPAAPTNGAAFVDVDRDGDEDLYLTTHAGEGTEIDPRTGYRLYIREGDRFVEQGAQRGAQVESRLNAPARAGTSVSVGDYDRDGWPDLHVNEWIGQAHAFPPHTRLLRNQGGAAPGHYEDVTEPAMAFSVATDCWFGIRDCEVVAFASAFSDLDDDGWPDLAIVKDYGHSRLLWNQGDGTFIDGTSAAGVGTDENGMGSTFGDVDNDGDVDWFITSIGNPRSVCGSEPCELGYSGNRLYRNDGDRSFTDITEEAGVRHGGWGWGTALFDYDNDGDLDLVMTNGMIYQDGMQDEFTHDLMHFWENDGTGHFEERSADVGLNDNSAGKGLIVYDYDDDGDQDLLIVVNGSTPLLYRNDGGDQAGSWLRLRVRGTASLPDSLGARVAVQITERSTPWVREVGSVTHFQGQSERVVHLGLGYGVERVHQIRVTWPSGRTRTLSDVEVGQRLEVVEPAD